MRLTIEENREALKRYRHVKPAPQKGPARCAALCPGTVRSCTLRRGHAGPHVAHGMFNRVLAVWDKGMKAPENLDLVPKPAAAVAGGRARPGKFLATIRAVRKQIVLK